MTPYYLAPPLILCLVMASRQGAKRFWSAVVIGLEITVFAYHHLNPWVWWLPVSGPGCDCGPRLSGSAPRGTDGVRRFGWWAGGRGPRRGDRGGGRAGATRAPSSARTSLTTGQLARPYCRHPVFLIKSDGAGVDDAKVSLATPTEEREAGDLAEDPTARIDAVGSSEDRLPAVGTPKWSWLMVAIPLVVVLVGGGVTDGCKRTPSSTSGSSGTSSPAMGPFSTSASGWRCTPIPCGCSSWR